MAFKQISLAMDLSLSQPGFAILAITDEDTPILLEKSYVKTRQAAKHGEKLTQIQSEIRRYFDAYNPEHVVREKSFSRFAASTQAIYKVNGVCDLTVYEYGLEAIGEIATTSVKKFVTGNGKSTKEQVAEAVFKRLQIENTDDFYYVNTKGERILIDDMTDAVAVGLAYYMQKGLIE